MYFSHRILFNEGKTTQQVFFFLSGQYTLLQYNEVDSGETDSTSDNTVSYLSKFKHVRNRLAIGNKNIFKKEVRKNVFF